MSLYKQSICAAHLIGVSFFMALPFNLQLSNQPYQAPSAQLKFAPSPQQTAALGRHAPVLCALR